MHTAEQAPTLAAAMKKAHPTGGPQAAKHWLRRRLRRVQECLELLRTLESARFGTVEPTLCCIAHFIVALGSHWAGGRLPPERKDPGQARIHIDALSAA